MVVFPPGLSDELRGVARREGVTLYMVLLAALQVVLSRWSGRQDFTVGSPIAGRTHRKLERLIGFFLNTLVMRADLSEEPTFTELLERVKKMTLGAFMHQDLPFEKLVAELRPERDLSRQALFQVMFTLQNMKISSLQLSGLTWKPVLSSATTSKFDVRVEFVERDSAVQGSVESATDLFDQATIERFAGNYRILLEAVVAGARRPVWRLPLLSEADQLQLKEWNRTEASRRGGTLEQLFEEQAERTPQAVAVVFEEQHLTYAELNRKANQLARHLQKRGAGPETRIGICMERSPGMIVGLLGILKTGSAYVPLDPEYPEDRLKYQLEDADTKALLTQRSLLNPAGSPAICLETIMEQMEQESEANLRIERPEDSLAYVIYTSGSTGRTKGAMNTHAGIRNRLLWQKQEH